MWGRILPLEPEEISNMLGWGTFVFPEHHPIVIHTHRIFQGRIRNRLNVALSVP
jgi:hypothetical protein